MKVAEFFNWAEREFEAEMELMRDKGKEYTVNDEDKLKNFKSIAERLKCKPEFVALTYLLKHMDSVRNYVLDGVEASNEPIEGRLRDIRNYILLLGALILERRESDVNGMIYEGELEPYAIIKRSRGEAKSAR